MEVAEGQVKRLYQPPCARYAPFMNERIIKSLCVFCGSSDGEKKIYRRAASDLGTFMGNNAIDLVYGGGGRGIMGELAASAKQAGSNVIGVIPTHIYEMVKHIAHQEDELIIVEGMHQRKATMYEKADAFVALPGGIGTLEEVLEIFTWLQLGYHQKPVGLLNVDNYFSLLLQFLHYMADQGFIRAQMVNTLVVESDPQQLLRGLNTVSLAIPRKIDSRS
jgi:uncharacterized protein (TIGR00730 family)